MLTKLFNKHSKKHEALNLNAQIITHYGIPSTASRLAYDPIQQLLAVGTLDGRIKVIGSDNIEGLLTSPNGISIKNLEFLQNQGFLISISTENDIQVWDLEHRYIAASLQWQSNITSFAVIQETNYMYLGDDCGSVYVIKYDAGERSLSAQKFNIPAQSVSEAAGISSLDHQSVVAVLPQPCSGKKRVLFAYDSGVIILWDVSKDQLVLVRGLSDQQMKDSAIHSTKDGTDERRDERTCDEQEGKEIVSLCWASLDGSVVAVGYMDGDILLWNLSGGATINDNKVGESANNVVKLQLSSADKRFPVIVLHWSASGVDNDHGGQLFVYGGDEIGSAEVLTILNLEWFPGGNALKNIFRTNITLEGSFADIILLPSFNVVENTGTSLFLLSSPGQLQFYDGPCLSDLMSHQDNSPAIPVNYRSTLPTTEPYLTVGKLILFHINTQYSALSEMLTRKNQSDITTKWPLNGGIPFQIPPLGERAIERLYIAGYNDGSVRIWDATYPMLLPLCILYPEFTGVSIPGATASISAVDFSAETSSIAVGNSSGVVCLYHLSKNSMEAKFYVVMGSNTEVNDLDEENISQLSAVFTVSASPVCTLRYIELGTRLAVGYESGQVAVLSIKSPSVLFLIEALSSSSSPIVSLSSIISLDTHGLMESVDESEPHGNSEPIKELVLALRRDALVEILDSSNGSIISSTPKHNASESTAISMYILDDTKCVSEAFVGTDLHTVSHEDKASTETEETSGNTEGSSVGINRSSNVVQSSVNLQVLVCCTDMLLLYSFESLIQGNAVSIFEVKLPKPNCWTSVFKIDKERHVLLLLYQNGAIEIRSLPKLEVLGDLSLMSILRWNFKTNMDKTTSSTENGQLTLVNGCEFAIVSLLARENDFRIPQSLPCLHDKALAAALNMNFSPNQKTHKETPARILSGIIKGLRASKESQCTDHSEDSNSSRSSLDRIFSRSSEDPSTAVKDVGEVVELNIDDIEIDEPIHVSPKPQKSKSVRKDESTERKKLFEGASSETKPKQRSIQEIKAKYRKEASSDVASAASEARNKLLERQEKLERIGQNSEELRNGAENFASMAQELAKRMECRKWWQL